MRNRIIKCLIVIFCLCGSAKVRDYIYQGTYLTTSPRPGGGSMTFVLTPIGVKNAKDKNNKYKCHFSATWNAYPGDVFRASGTVYGPIHALKCNVSGSNGNYNWAGYVTKDEMKANFTGNYQGSLHLKRAIHLEKNHAK